MAYDTALSIEVRQEILATMLTTVSNEFDRALIESHLEWMAMQRMALDRVD